LKIFYLTLIVLSFLEKKPTGRSVTQHEMMKTIKDLKFKLAARENKKEDKNLKKQVVWEENDEDRIQILKEIIEFTSEKGAGKGEFLIFNENYRKLDFWKSLYEEHEDFDFKIDFDKASVGDNTKPYRRYTRGHFILQDSHYPKAIGVFFTSCGIH
jgi:hypothetical protein